MKINTDSWHYKLYIFMAQWNAAWLHNDNYIDYPLNRKKIGLCEYMRMILIWGPLSILSNLIPLGLVFLVLFSFPFYANGTIGVLWLFGFVGFIIATSVVLGRIADWKSDRKEALRKSQIYDEYDDYDDCEDDREPDQGFATLMKEYLKSIKSKICPILEVNK